jgi:type VI secretion system protein ImpF
MAARGGRERLNPTLFDKLVVGNEIAGLRGDELEGVEQRRETLRYYSVPQLERFNEDALRATIKRELAWLLNTTNLEAVEDLEAAPNVRTSVLNYGVPDLAGKALNRRLLLKRARDIKAAIVAFEPRIAEESLSVEVANTIERENAITFVIEADVRSAVRAVPIKLRSDIEADSASVTVRD